MSKKLSFHQTAILQHVARMYYTSIQFSEWHHSQWQLFEILRKIRKEELNNANPV